MGETCSVLSQENFIYHIWSELLKQVNAPTFPQKIKGMDETWSRQIEIRIPNILVISPVSSVRDCKLGTGAFVTGWVKSEEVLAF